MENKKAGAYGDPKMVSYFNLSNKVLSDEDIKERIEYLLSTNFQAKNIYKMVPNIDELLNEHFKGTHLSEDSDERFRSNFLLERLYAYIHGIKYCDKCGKHMLFLSRHLGYPGKTCMECYRHDYTPADTYQMKIGTCLYCGKEFPYEYRPNNAHYQTRDFCCASCREKYNQANMSPEKRAEAEAKRQATCMEKYGDPHVVNSQYTRDKTKEKIGVDYAWKLENYGEICKESYKEHHDGQEYHVSDETKAKIIKTKTEKYGSVLVPTLRYKEYTFPSGKTCYIQGYEDLALDRLLETHSEDDIVVEKHNIKEEVGQFFYKDENGFEHEYFPDIYIRSDNKVVEVKSPHTYNCHLDTNEKKRDCVKSKGINFEFWVIVPTRTKPRTIKSLTII